MSARFAQWRQAHAGLGVLLLLFVSFRLLALLLLRPGGFITDFSDYDFYATWGTLVPMGYAAYDNLWTAYPPLFPAIMLAVFEAASRIPAWTEPRLAFHVLFGLALLVFDMGNLLLVYRLAGRLAAAEPASPPAGWGTQSLYAAALYALFFVPTYTMLGWFEPLPLFFMLLGLELLLVPRAWGWTASALAAGLGFLTKLTPILLLPIAVRWLGSRLSWDAARREWFNPRAAGNLLRPALYTLIFGAVVVGVGYPLVAANPALALSSFRIQSIRPPWQSVWALIDGFYGYGLVPLDMRNLDGLQRSLWDSRIPWGAVGLGFALVYLWLYTRAYDWTKPRTPIALSAAGVILLFLYSKGWSPQFLLWVLVFIALLLPTARGVTVGVFLSLVNFVEADVFLILLPDEHWIMTGTVLARTALLVLLLVEFVAQIWPRRTHAATVQRAVAWASVAVMVVATVAALAGTPRAAQAYWDRRWAEHPCQAAVSLLRAEAGGPNTLIVTQQTEVWRDLYPWLREEYTFHVLDGYTPEGDRADATLARANEHVNTEFWWIARTDAPYSGTSPAVVLDRYREQPGVRILEERAAGACRLMRVLRLDGAPLATAAAAGGPITLARVVTGPGQVGRDLRVVLYWQAAAPVTGRYTVFTQLFDPAGSLVAQQDNWPVRGLAPTDTWQPGALIRDPYVLTIPRDGQPGAYRLWVGLYDDAGRRTLTLADGSQADHLELSVTVTE